MALLLKGARVVDPQVNLDKVVDVLVRDGRVVEVGEGLSLAKGVEVDLSGKVLMPGFIDIHVHFRDPGQEYKEDIESGSRAAVRGGFTAVATMPNTSPIIDKAALVTYQKAVADQVNMVRLYPMGAITKGLQGKELAEIGDMHRAGAVAFTDDGHGLASARMARTAMEYIKQFGACYSEHCEDYDLSGGGVVNEGAVSTRLGIAGYPAEAEEIMIDRDIALARLTGCRVHFQHVSTARGARAVCRAQEEGLDVTCEVTPHHLFLCEDDITNVYDTNFKMNPPLRTREDMLALQEMVAAGQIACVATDHAPHAPHEKAIEFENAPNGIIGLESAVPLMLDRLVNTGAMSLSRLVEVMSINPRKVIGVEEVTVSPGSVADFTVVDLDREFTLTPEMLESKARNTPFLGVTGKGCVTDVFLGGYARMRDMQIVCELPA